RRAQEDEDGRPRKRSLPQEQPPTRQEVRRPTPRDHVEEGVRRAPARDRRRQEDHRRVGGPDPDRHDGGGREDGGAAEVRGGGGGGEEGGGGVRGDGGPARGEPADDVAGDGNEVSAGGGGGAAGDQGAVPAHREGEGPRRPGGGRASRLHRLFDEYHHPE